MWLRRSVGKFSFWGEELVVWQNKIGFLFSVKFFEQNIKISLTNYQYWKLAKLH